MRMKREKEDEEEDKKVVVPPVDRNLLPAADRKALLQDGGAQGRRKALRLHAVYHAQNSACARCSSSPCPLGAWDVAIEPQPDRSIAPSTHAAAAAVAKGRLVSQSSPERALRQRAGGGTSPLRPRLLLAAEDRGAHGRPRMLHRRQLHRVVAPRGGRSLRHLLGLVLVEGHLAAAEKALFRGEMGQFWPTRRRASWVAPARESTRHTGPSSSSAGRAPQPRRPHSFSRANGSSSAW